MSDRNVPSRVLHDLGLAAWFGGTLANAVSLNAAAAKAGDERAVGAVANEGWLRWTPVNAAAIAAHLVGGLGQIQGNKSRIAGQKGVGAMTVTKTILTGAALAATGWSGVLQRRLTATKDVPMADGTTPSAHTPAEVAAAQAQVKKLQWAIPALTGALMVVTSFAGEQQRASSVVTGVRKRLTS